MQKILDIRSRIPRKALTPRAMPYPLVATNASRHGDVSALAERWMR